MEELKLILETIQALGTEAKWAFIVYLAYKAGVLVTIVSTILVLAHWIIRALVRANSDERTLLAIADTVEGRYYEPDELIAKVAILKKQASG